MTYLFRREICIFHFFFFTSICGPIFLISISLLLCYLWCLSFPFRRKTTHLKRNSEKKLNKRNFFGNIGELETIKFNLTLPMFEKLLLLSNGESYVNLRISKSEYLRVYYDKWYYVWHVDTGSSTSQYEHCELKRK